MNNSNQTALAENITNIGHNFEPIWDSTEAARYLRIHPRTLTRMARRGEIPAIAIGRLWRFRRVDLDAWLKNRVSSVSYPCRLNSKGEKE